MHFSDRLAGVIKAKNSCLMLGLDPNWEKLPSSIKNGETLQEKADIYQKFCVDMVDVCADKICGIKIQMGYFEALGSVGVKAVENVIAHTRLNHPELIIMMDAKRGDIGSTSEAYAQAFLGAESPLSGDCVTVAPYMGHDSIIPFLMLARDTEKGVFVLAKTSNPTSNDIQDQPISNETNKTVAEFWAGMCEFHSQVFKKRENPLNDFGLCGLVVGATHPEDLPKFGDIAPSCWLLCPGVGAQGGTIENVLKVRPDKTRIEDKGILIPVSRSVIYASGGEDYLTAAQAEIDKFWAAQKL